MNRRLTTIPAVAAAAVAGLVLAACGGGEDAAEETTDAATDAATDEATDEPSPEDTLEVGAGEAVGPGCADLADALGTLASEPLTTAVGSVDQLSQLTAALSGGLNPEVDLLPTLSGGDVTVFAPVDDAFAGLDPATLDTLSADAEALTTILTYHVVPGQLTPDEVAGTSQTTLEGTDVVVEGEADALTVNGATVVCGGIATADAQVYLIDGVLDPATAPAPGTEGTDAPTGEPTGDSMDEPTADA